LIVAAGLIVICSIVAIGLTHRGDTKGDAKPGRGRVAPAFDLADLRHPDDRVALADFRGRPVVLNFWASWCVPCRREMPAFEAVARASRDRVAFVGVNHQDSRDDALRFLRETGVSYRSGFDPAGDVARRYGLYGMPTTVFISADGRIIATRTGEISRTELTNRVRELSDHGR